MTHNDKSNNELSQIVIQNHCRTRDKLPPKQENLICYQKRYLPVPASQLHVKMGTHARCRILKSPPFPWGLHSFLPPFSHETMGILGLTQYRFFLKNMEKIMFKLCIYVQYVHSNWKSMESELVRTFAWHTTWHTICLFPTSKED